MLYWNAFRPQGSVSEQVLTVLQQIGGGGGDEIFVFVLIFLSFLHIQFKVSCFNLFCMRCLII